MCLPFVSPGSKPSIRAEQRSMNATSISFGLLIVLFTILLLHRMRKLKPQVAGFQSQRMCPPCGLITSRLKASCLECGKPFTAVVLLDFKEITAAWLRLPITFRSRTYDMETSLPRKSALHQLLSDLPIALCEWLRKPMVRGFAHRFGAAWIASINRGCLSENNIRQALRERHKAALSSSPASERSRETMPGCRREVAVCVLQSVSDPHRSACS